MRKPGTRPSLGHMLFATFLGLLLGAAAGLALESHVERREPRPESVVTPSVNPYTGVPRTATTDGTMPAYVVLPAVGASAGFLWTIWRRNTRQ